MQRNMSLGFLCTWMLFLNAIPLYVVAPFLWITSFNHWKLSFIQYFYVLVANVHISHLHLSLYLLETFLYLAATMILLRCHLLLAFLCFDIHLRNLMNTLIANHCISFTWINPPPWFWRTSVALILG